MENKTPSLPRDGAQNRAKQIHEAAHDNNNQAWMAVPPAGMAG